MSIGGLGRENLFVIMELYCREAAFLILKRIFAISFLKIGSIVSRFPLLIYDFRPHMPYHRHHHYIGAIATILILLSTSLLGQTRQRRFTIDGFIHDSQSGETLIAANVLELNSKSGAVTNEFGHYSLTLPAGEVQLQFSYVGYQSDTIRLHLTADTTLSVSLTEGQLLGEVVVVGSANPSGVGTTNIGTQRILASEIKRLPAFFGEQDVIKALQLLPGVQSGTEGSSGLYVRGGDPDQNLILMDGISLYNPNHLLGAFSTFNPDAVKSVTLYKGTFPARYGGRLSSVVDVRLKDGDMQEYHGNVSVGLISSKINLEGPIVKDRTTFNVSARRTYLDILAGIALAIRNATDRDEGEKLMGGYNFHDINLKLTHRFSDKDQLYLFAYYGNDQVSSSISYSDESKEQMSWLWGNAMSSLRWNHAISGQLFLNTTASYTQYRSKLRLKAQKSKSDPNTTMSYDSGIRDWLLTSELNYSPSDSHKLLFGGNYTFHTFRPEMTSIKVNDKNIQDLTEELGFNLLGHNPEIYAHEAALYAEDEMKLGDMVSLHAGLRYGFYIVRNKGYHSLEPRLSVAWRITPRLTAKAGYALMTQHAHLLSNNSLSLPTDLWVPTTDRIKPMQTHHFTAGVYLNVPEWGDFSLEGYYKPMSNVLEYKEGATFYGSSTNWEQLVAMGRGTAYGVELLWQRSFGKVTGWISYAWARALRLFDQPGETINFGRPFPAKYDRMHDFKITAMYQLNTSWDLSATWVFASGHTGTIATHRYNNLEDPLVSSDFNSQTLDYAEQRNNYRFRPYHRLDLGVSYTKRHRKGKSIWNLSVYNAYNQMNPFLTTPSLKYNSDGTSQLVLLEITIFPILPNISYTYSF